MEPAPVYYTNPALLATTPDVIVPLATLVGMCYRPAMFGPDEWRAAVLDAAAALDAQYQVVAPGDSLPAAILRRAQEQLVGGAWAGSMPFSEAHAQLCALYFQATGGRDLCHDAAAMAPDEDA